MRHLLLTLALPRCAAHRCRQPARPSSFFRAPAPSGGALDCLCWERKVAPSWGRKHVIVFADHGAKRPCAAAWLDAAKRGSVIRRNTMDSLLNLSRRNLVKWGLVSAGLPAVSGLLGPV